MKIPSQQQIDDAVNQGLRKAADVTIAQIRKDSAAILEHKRKFFFTFERRIYRRYANAFDLHETIMWICFTEGQVFNETHSPRAAKKGDAVFEALARLHAHGCLIASEILALLRTGHADGASGRWRSLHETVVVAMFIAKHGQDTAERFLLHRIVKSHEDAAVYQDHCEKLGYQRFSQSEMDEMQKQYDAVLKKFGDDYKGGCVAERQPAT